MSRFLIAIAGIALLAYATYVAKTTIELRKAAPGAAPFILRDQELTKTIKAAEEGDCKQAYRLGEHFLFGLNQAEEATKWYRVAAACPGIEPRMTLVGILAYDLEKPGVAEELTKLIAEIARQDPIQAERAQKHVDHMQEDLRKEGARPLRPFSKN